MEPIARSFTDNSWVFIVLLSIILLLGVSRIIFQRNYASLGTLTIFQENQENFLPLALMTNAMLIMLIGLVFYPFFQLNWNILDWPPVFNLFGIVFLWLFIRFIANTLLIYLLGLDEYYRDIIKAKIYFRLFGVLALLVSVMFLYYSDVDQKIMFYISLGILVIMNLFEYIFQLRKNGLNGLYGSYYFILYLCMLEILPILYVINHWNG